MKFTVELNSSHAAIPYILELLQILEGQKHQVAEEVLFFTKDFLSRRSIPVNEVHCPEEMCAEGPPIESTRSQVLLDEFRAAQKHLDNLALEMTGRVPTRTNVR